MDEDLISSTHLGIFGEYVRLAHEALRSTVPVISAQGTPLCRLRVRELRTGDCYGIYGNFDGELGIIDDIPYLICARRPLFVQNRYDGGLIAVMEH